MALLPSKRLRVLRRAPAFLIGKRPVLFAPESGDTLRRVNSTRPLVVIWVPGLANALLPTDTNCTNSETIPDTRTPETGTWGSERSPFLLKKASTEAEELNDGSRPGDRSKSS